LENLLSGTTECMQATKLRFAVVPYLIGMLIVHAAVFWNVREQILKGYSDFTIYYCAGTMVRDGLGHQLYDGAAQFAVQKKFAPDVPIRLGALPFNHPPFEALVFVPFSYVSYPSAFVAWALANLAMLLSIPSLLPSQLRSLSIYSWPLWMLASLGFFPIFFSLLQGQDAILLLFLYTLAFSALNHNRDTLAGGLLALGLFKPHLVLPFVVLLLAQGRKKVLYGFFPVAAVLGLVSIAAVGWQGMTLYPRYVLHLEGTMAQGAITPSAMPNLRGVVYLLFRGDAPLAYITLALSVAVIFVAAWQCRAPGRHFSPKFSLAVTATVLVSYHCLGYDLSILLLPILLCGAELLGKEGTEWFDFLILAASAALYFSPLELLLQMRMNRLALMGWVVLTFFFGLIAKVSARPHTVGAIA